MAVCRARLHPNSTRHAQASHACAQGVIWKAIWLTQRRASLMAATLSLLRLAFMFTSPLLLQQLMRVIEADGPRGEALTGHKMRAGRS